MASYLTASMQASREKGVKKYLKKRKAEFIEAISEHQATNLRQNPPKFQRKPLKRYSDTTQKPKRAYKRIKPLSAKRAAQYREYNKIRPAYLKENPKCAVYPDLQSVDIHHRKGKIGKLLLDTRFFLPTSRKGHIFIENNPAIAYKRGWSLKRLATT